VLNSFRAKDQANLTRNENKNLGIETKRKNANSKTSNNTDIEFIILHGNPAKNMNFDKTIPFPNQNSPSGSSNPLNIFKQHELFEGSSFNKTDF